MPSEFEPRIPDLFEREAFRLELLDEYDAPATRERVRRFLAGEPQNLKVRAYWDGLIADARRAGKNMSRVHVVTEPLNDYLRFELDFYRGSVAVGEDIGIIPRADAAGLELPEFDFWLFDGQTAAVMIYGWRGTWLRTVMITDPSFVADCCRWRDIALSNATPLSAYMTESEVP